MKQNTKMPKGAVRDQQTVLPDSTIIRALIDGVKVVETKNIVTRNGVTTEFYRADWSMWNGNVQHIIHASFRPGAISAWHCHQLQTDNIFVTQGTLRLVLYDARQGSPTCGKVNVFNLSLLNPLTVVIPPMIWHGLQNLEQHTSAMVNYFDRSYEYENPDEWRLPLDTEEIPYRF
jgi:dTDP-4-dehydrorhamnose 3,5-epimerase